MKVGNATLVRNSLGALFRRFGPDALIVANIATEPVSYAATADLDGGKLANVSVTLPPTSARAVLLHETQI